MNRHLIACAAAVLAAGCQEAPRAPLDLESSTEFLFTNFNGDTTELGLAILDLEAAITASGTDLTGDKDQRSFSLPILQGEALGDLEQVPETDPANQTPALVLGKSIHDYAENVTLASEPNHVCIESDTTVAYEREYLSDLACFEDGSCDTVQSVNAVRKENLLAKAWYDLFKD
jgi:hypothetical protein